MSIVFLTLSFQVLNALDLEVLDFLHIFVIGYFGVVFDLEFQTFKNSFTYVFSKEQLLSLLN